MGNGGKERKKNCNLRWTLRGEGGKLPLYHLVSSDLKKSAYLFFSRVAYGRLNGDDIWARRKSRRLSMIPGGIYSSKSGKVYFMIEKKKKVFTKVSKQCMYLMSARKGDNVQKKKECKPTGC